MISNIEIDNIVEKFYNDNFEKLEEKSSLLLKNLQKLKINKNKLFQVIKNNPSFFNSNMNNILDNLDIINNDLCCLNDDFDNLNICIENNIFKDCSSKTQDLINNKLHTQKVLKPFLPYLLLYNCLT